MSGSSPFESCLFRLLSVFMGLSSCLAFPLILAFSYLFTLSVHQFCVSYCRKPLSPPPLLLPHPGLVILWVCFVAATLEPSSLFWIWPPSLQPCSFLSRAGRSSRTVTVPQLLKPMTAQPRALTTPPSSQALARETSSQEPLTSATSPLPWFVHVFAWGPRCWCESLQGKLGAKAIPILQHYCSESFDPNSVISLINKLINKLSQFLNLKISYDLTKYFKLKKL